MDLTPASTAADDDGPCQGTLVSMMGSYHCRLPDGHQGLHEAKSWSPEDPITWSILHQFSGCLWPFRGWDSNYGPEPVEAQSF